MNDIVRKWVGTWLFLGCAMVFFQVIVGGVTRLTESGLSITEWKPVKGVVPPLNEAEWQKEFELYQQIAQFKTVNQDMTVEEFKWIYFWEYFHRFWARFMGLVFIIPFSFFVIKKWFDKDLFKKIGVLFLWGGVIGIYGWIMVRSGLTGMYVPPVHLSIHLLLALGLFAYLVWLTVYVLYGSKFVLLKNESANSLQKILLAISVLVTLQIFFGGIVSGMKAGLAYPTWPDMNGEIIPAALFSETATLAGFTKYNVADYWGRTAIQFAHRGAAYLIVAIVVFFFLKARKIEGNKIFNAALKLLPATVLLQATIGIFTVINCVGSIPVGWGVLHQAGAMLLIANVAVLWFGLNRTGRLNITE
jgi:cytochrome c oxidase assembly protein subunit 15